MELKFDPGFRVIREYLSQINSILRVKLSQYWESNWLNIESQIDSILRVKLTQYWESNWLNIESQIDSILRVKWTQYWESNWLNIESQIDSILRVKLTEYWESNWLKYSPNTWIPGRILVRPVTQLLRSKWPHFFSFSAARDKSYPFILGGDNMSCFCLVS